jgi:hypothetical protein
MHYRLALATTQSPEETWSMAPAIEMSHPVAQPFETIFRHVGKNLRYLELFGGKDYPAIIQHVGDHCPFLVTLSMPDNMLSMFKRQEVHIAKVLARLKHLTLRRTETRESLILQRLGEALKLVDSPPRMTSLTMGVAPGAADSDLLVTIVQRLPKLEILSAPITPTDVSLIKRMCDVCPSLRQIQGVRIIDQEFNSVRSRFQKKDAAELLKTNIGFNMTVGEWGMPFVQAISTRVNLGSVPFLSWLHKIGLKQPIDVHLFIEMFLAGQDYLRVLPVVQAGLNPVLPSLDRIRFSPSIMMLWGYLLTKESIESFQKVVSYLGAPPVQIRTIVLPSILAHSAVDVPGIEVFVNAFLELCDFDLCKYLSAPLEPLNNHIWGLFRNPSAAGLHWLLEHVPEPHVRTYLTRKDDKIGSVILHYLKNIPAHADLVWDRFQDVSLFCFPDADRFTQAACACLRAKKLSLLERIVAAVGGFENVPGECRGCFLWYSLHEKEFQTYWLDHLVRYPDPEPQYFAVCDAEPAASLLSALDVTYVFFASSKNVVAAIEKNKFIFLAMIEQLKAVEPDNVRRLFGGFVRHPVDIPSTRDFYCDTLFPVFARALGRLGESTCVALFKQITETYYGSTLARLFRTCVEIDFAEENKHMHAAITSGIAFELRYRLDIFLIKGSNELVEDCLDMLTAEDLNQTTEYSKVNLMDMILIRENACRFDKLPELITKLARRGGRITASENTNERYELNALHAYCIETGNEELDPHNPRRPQYYSAITDGSHEWHSE